MRLVGLTGGIACGKSTVSQLLAQEGLSVIDADVIAHSVVQKGRWGYRRVVNTFGTGILCSSGEIDREALAALVFNDTTQRRRLNAATHPAVGLELLRQILLAWLLCRPAVVIDMPLLFETGFYRLTQPRVLVACSPVVQRQRLMQRDKLMQAAADARVASQMPLERKRQLADVVVDNDGSLEQLQQQAAELARRLRRRAWLHRYILSPPSLLAAAAAAWALWPAASSAV